MIGKAPERTHGHVAVLMGGWSAEREVSLQLGSCVRHGAGGRRAIASRRSTSIATSRRRLRDVSPDVCFNALHGRFGEDGCVQGLLECLGIPYTHSGVLASALAMHKERAKDVMGPAGVPVADAEVVTRREAMSRHVLAPPYVVKPVAEGSSVGVVIVDVGANAPPAKIGEGGSPDDLLMVERYIPGRELTCAVIGDFVTEVIEIKPLKGLDFYDYEAKYAPGGSQHVLPADILPDVYQLVRKYTVAACRALGCRGAARADFRYDDTTDGAGELICLEVNTQPGMTETSWYPSWHSMRAGHSASSYGGWSRTRVATGRGRDRDPAAGAAGTIAPIRTRPLFPLHPTPKRLPHTSASALSPRRPRTPRRAAFGRKLGLAVFMGLSGALVFSILTDGGKQTRAVATFLPETRRGPLLDRPAHRAGGAQRPALHGRCRRFRRDRSAQRGFAR